MTRLITVVAAAALASGCAVRTGYVEPMSPVGYYAPPVTYAASYGAYDAPRVATWQAPYADYSRPDGFYARPYVAAQSRIAVQPRPYVAVRPYIAPRPYVAVQPRPYVAAWPRVTAPPRVVVAPRVVVHPRAAAEPRFVALPYVKVTPHSNPPAYVGVAHPSERRVRF